MLDDYGVEAFMDTLLKECECGDALEWEITIYGAEAECEECGDVYEFEPFSDEEEQSIRY